VREPALIEVVILVKVEFARLIYPVIVEERRADAREVKRLQPREAPEALAANRLFV
jgi:hypothetical protein